MHVALLFGLAAWAIWHANASKNLLLFGSAHQLYSSSSVQHFSLMHINLA